jgi:hypothetical protein
VLNAVSGNTLTGSQKAEITTYFSAVATAIKQTTTELQSTDAAAVKAANILGYFAAGAVPNLTGLPATVATAVQAVAAIVAGYLSQYRAASAGVQAEGAIPARFGFRDRRALDDLKKRAEKIQARIAVEAAR